MICSLSGSQWSEAEKFQLFSDSFFFQGFIFVVTVFISVLDLKKKSMLIFSRLAFEEQSDMTKSPLLFKQSAFVVRKKVSV